MTDVSFSLEKLKWVIFRSKYYTGGGQFKPTPRLISKNGRGQQSKRQKKCNQTNPRFRNQKRNSLSEGSTKKICETDCETSPLTVKGQIVNFLYPHDLHHDLDLPQPIHKHPPATRRQDGSINLDERGQMHATISYQGKQFQKTHKRMQQGQWQTTGDQPHQVFGALLPVNYKHSLLLAFFLLNSTLKVTQPLDSIALNVTAK